MLPSVLYLILYTHLHLMGHFPFDKFQRLNFFAHIISPMCTLNFFLKRMRLNPSGNNIEENIAKGSEYLREPMDGRSW